MMMMIMERHITAVVNQDLVPNALNWNQAKLGEEGFCKRFFHIFGLPPPNPWLLKPGTWSVKKIAHVWQVEGQQRTLWLKHRFTAARMTWALRAPEGFLKDSATHCIIERSYFHNNREQWASIYAGVPDLEETVTLVQWCGQNHTSLKWGKTKVETSIKRTTRLQDVLQFPFSHFFKAVLCYLHSLFCSR